MGWNKFSFSYIGMKEGKVDETMADHLSSNHSRKWRDHHLIQLGGVVLPRYVGFLAKRSNIERLSCSVGSTSSNFHASQVIVEWRTPQQGFECCVAICEVMSRHGCFFSANLLDHE